jgi:hypothetical protein
VSHKFEETVSQIILSTSEELGHVTKRVEGRYRGKVPGGNKRVLQAPDGGHSVMPNSPQVALRLWSARNKCWRGRTDGGFGEQQLQLAGVAWLTTACASSASAMVAARVVVLQKATPWPLSPRAGHQTAAPSACPSQAECTARATPVTGKRHPRYCASDRQMAPPRSAPGTQTAPPACPVSEGRLVTVRCADAGEPVRLVQRA